MGFPSKAETARALKRIGDAPGSQALGANPSPLELFRFELSQMFIKYRMYHGLNQRELAERLGVDEAKVSKILHHRLDEFSTDRLIDLYSRLEPGLKLRIC